MFDRGCFHTFDGDRERARFAQAVATQLVEGGVRLSLIGSTEGRPRDVGPPRRSAREIMNAIEPALEILQLRAGEFSVNEEPLKAWLCLSRKRTIPAQRYPRGRFSRLSRGQSDAATKNAIPRNVLIKSR